MEKYLKKTESDGTDVSAAHTAFDLTAWVDNPSSSQRDHSEQWQSLTLGGDSNTEEKPASKKTDDRRGETFNSKLSAASLLKPSSPGQKRDAKRSSIPRPCTSSRKSLGSEGASIIRPSADKAGHFTKTCGSSGRNLTEHGVQQGEIKLQTSNSKRASVETSQRGEKSSASSSGLPITPPASRKGQSGLSSGSTSPMAHSMISSGQQQHISNNSPEKKLPLRNVMAAPLPSSSVEKHVGISQPQLNSASGEYTTKIWLLKQINN